MSAEVNGMNAPPPVPSPEICVRGGVACYLCGIAIGNGDLAMVYRDARFWDQLFFYHAGCWNEADLPAKMSDSRPLLPAPAVELPEGYCLVCRAPLEAGDLVVREWVREGRGVRIYHAHCVPHGGRG